MNMRGSELYVSYKTKRRLRWLAKAMSRGDEGVTADALGDHFLTEVIEARFPAIKECEEEVDNAERRFMEHFSDKLPHE